jgi:hypothetical protein
VTDLLRVINPMAPIETESDARTAGRAGAIGAFLMAAAGVIGALEMILTVDAYLAVMRDTTVAMYGEGTETTRAALTMMTPTMVYMTAAFSLVVVLVYAVLGAVQWRKPNAVIPLLLGLWSAYGLLMVLIGHLNGTAAAAHLHIPIWRQVLSVAVGMAALVFFYAGFRGANRLGKLRREAAA